MDAMLKVGNSVLPETITNLKELVMNILNNPSDTLVKVEALKIIGATMSSPKYTTVSNCSFVNTETTQEPSNKEGNEAQYNLDC